MDDKKIKDGIEHFIGKEKMFTNEMKNRILFNQHQDEKSKRGVFMKLVKPILTTAMLLIVFGGMLFFITSEKPEERASGTAAEEELLEKTLAENKELEERITTMMNEHPVQLQEKGNEIAMLKEQIKALSESNTEAPNIHFYGANVLKNHFGYEGNEQDIIAELLLHPEIIPYDGILGGTMFMRAEGAIVLSHEWIFVPYEDGHTAGYLLVEYTIKDGKPTDWKVIDSYILGDEDK